MRDFIHRLQAADPELPRFNRSYPELSFFRALNDRLQAQREAGLISWLQASWGRDYVDWLASDREISVDKMVKLNEKKPVAETVLTLAEAIIADINDWKEEHGRNLGKYNVLRFTEILRLPADELSGPELERIY